MQTHSKLSNYETTIQSLKVQLEQAKQENLETVEEALCPSCKRSMEESVLGDTHRDAISAGINEAKLEEQVNGLKAQLSVY